MPADAELRTKISLETDGAAEQMQSMLAKAQQARQSEFTEYERIVQNMSSMSVEEMAKQVSAQEKLLDTLKIKQDNLHNDELDRIVREYAERERGYIQQLKALDDASAKTAQLHDQKMAQLQQLRQINADDETAERNRAGAVKQLEEELANIVSQSKDNYMAKTELAFSKEKDRLDALRAMSEAISPVTMSEAGGVGTVREGVMQGVGERLSTLPAMINKAGSTLQRAMAPMLRILGPVGIAFSLEQVVEKLYKANEELRVIRANYADIAASMGDLVGGGGFLMATNQGQLMQLQRDIVLRFGDAVDEKLIPTLARSITSGGFQPDAVAGLTETALLMGTGAGVNPQEIAGLMAKSHREFGVSEGSVADVAFGIIQDSRDLRVPFQDLSKWILSLTDQTRIFGYDLDDSRKIVKEFAHEIERGTVTLGDLIKVQRSMSSMNTSSSLAMIQYLDAIGGNIELPGGGTLASTVRGAGTTIEQSAFLRYIGEGVLPVGVRESGGASERYGRFFNMETGDIKDEFSNVNTQMLQNVIKLARQMGEQIGGSTGAFTANEMTMQLLRMFNMDMSGMPTRTQNDLLEGIMSGQFGARDIRGGIANAGSGATVGGISPLDKLVSQGEQLLEQRKSLSGDISTGMKIWWRDTSEGIEVMLRRTLGGQLQAVQAQMGTRVGSQAIGAVIQSGIDLEGSGVIPTETIARGVSQAYQSTGESGRTATSDLLNYLTSSGRLPGATTSGLMDAFYRPYGIKTLPMTASPYDPATGGDVTLDFGDLSGAVKSYRSQTARDTVIQAMRGLSSGNIDADPRTKGVQINVGGTQVTIMGTGGGLLSEQEIKRQLIEAFDALGDNIVEQYRQVLMDPTQ